MNLLFIASTEAQLAYIIITPILLVIATVGFALAFTRFRLLANISGGLLVLYVYLDSNADRYGLVDIVGFIYTLMIIASGCAGFYVWKNVREAPKWFLAKCCRYSLIRLLFLLLSIHIQFLTAVASWKSFLWATADSDAQERARYSHKVSPAVAPLPPTDSPERIRIVVPRITPPSTSKTEKKTPNQAPEPTPTTVTPPAGRLRKASPGETQEARQP